MEGSNDDLPLDSGSQWYSDIMNEDEVFENDGPQRVVVQRGEEECLDERSMSVSCSPTSMKLTNACLQNTNSASIPNGSAASDETLDNSDQVFESKRDEQLSILQAVVFIEDAAKYRDINHKIDKRSLTIYRWHHSIPILLFRYFVIFVLHMLAFIEFPSSLTWTSDMRIRGERIQIPCGVTETVELLCLVLLLVDTLVKIALIGRHEFLRKKWLLLALVILALSITDWFVTIGMSCLETVRFRRMLRPFFILQNSNLMKKTVNCLRRTLPEVVSVLALLALHLCIFTLLGMLIFPSPRNSGGKNNTLGAFGVMKNNSTGKNSSDIVVNNEAPEYFRTLSDAFINLLVLLTTANNPDVMMPAYKSNRFYSLFFIIFLIVGNYCFMNMFLAVIYNQFRGYFRDSLQASLLRRRVGVRAAYEVLKEHEQYTNLQDSSSFSSEGVKLSLLESVVKNANLPYHSKKMLFNEMAKHKHKGEEIFSSAQFQKYFDLLETDHYHREKPSVRWFDYRYIRMIQRCIAHRYYNYVGNIVALVNVIMISVELSTQYDQSLNSSKSVLNIVNFAFVLYYCIEQIVKFIALGWKRYIYERWNIFDGLITVALGASQLIYVAEYGLPLSRSKEEIRDSLQLWNIVRIINILIMVRVLRIIPHIKAMSIVANTLVDLIRNLKAFGGILMAMYYSYAILGIEIFHDTIKFDPNKNSSGGLDYDCGTYQQLEYWPNNFDDFAAALVVLWDVMVVNNWSIFLYAYAKAMTKWSYLYFIVWWLISVLIFLNLFTALIIENFIMKWDRNNQNDNDGRPRSESGLLEESIRYMSIHEMFRGNLQEPSEGEILNRISQHRHLNFKDNSQPGTS